MVAGRTPFRTFFGDARPIPPTLAADGDPSADDAGGTAIAASFSTDGSRRILRVDYLILGGHIAGDTGP